MTARSVRQFSADQVCLSESDKVFSQVLLARLKPLLTRRQRRRPQQSGFTKGRSTVDAILALRLLAELRREFGKPPDVAKSIHRHEAAFDSVDRGAL